MPPINPSHNYSWKQAAWSRVGERHCCPFLWMGRLCLPLRTATVVGVAGELGPLCCGVTRRTQGQGIPRVLCIQVWRNSVLLGLRTLWYLGSRNSYWSKNCATEGERKALGMLGSLFVMVMSGIKLPLQRMKTYIIQQSLCFISSGQTRFYIYEISTVNQKTASFPKKE